MGDVINLPEFKSEAQPELRIVLEVEGATEEDLARGVAAAIAFFEEAGVDPWAAAEASHEMEWGGASEMTLSEAEAEMGTVYWKAIEVALKAACTDLPNTPKKYDFSLIWSDEPPYAPHKDVLEVVRPTTQHGRPAAELGLLKPGPRRILAGWNWEWANPD
ncbi:MAG: hypothetical protein Q7K57_07510 [Burkholderiaceae bacterium]|nr:hypothetical protein [Burkholderiaceae bacterium]